MALWIGYVKAWIVEQKGQDLVEYAMLLALLALAALVGMSLVGDEIAAIWGEIVTELKTR